MRYEFPINSEGKRVVFCDLGGVGWLLKDMNQWWEKLHRASAWSEIEKFKTAKKIALEIAWEPFERGEINLSEFPILFQRILGLTSMSAKTFWDLYMDITREINIPLVGCLHQMRERGIILALLSNLDEERYKYIREKRSDEYKTVTTPFHYLFFSWQIRSRKPEPKIYRHVFKEVSVLPQNAYYLDDFEPNIVGMADAIPGMPRENMLLYHADRHDEEAMPFFRQHGLIS